VQSENVAKSIFSEAVPQLLVDHFRHLSEGSGINLDVIKERGYRSILEKVELEKLGYSAVQERVPGILVPLWDVQGKEAGCQYRPDNPRLDAKGRPIKYESLPGSANRLDCPPRCRKFIGSPHTPLWITEGSKKADALASHGACAVSLTGVWGFKGKNEFGGKTFLTDWDHVAFNGRNIYLTFDSDILTKEPVRKALEYLVEHLRRKDAIVHVVYLPQEDDKKVGIDDYLLKHSLQEAEKLASDFKKQEFEPREQPVSGFILPDGTIGEMVISENEERTFMVLDGTKVKQARYYETPRSTLVPTDDILAGQVVHFAPTAIPYVSQAVLFKEVKEFVHRYLELPANFEDIASLYVLLTWVYEFSPSIPYLRVIGDWGSGKTRFLQVVGSVCFRPIFASGATTPAPIFRILEQFRGTLVLDEADFKDSSSWVEMVKLLNNGYRPGMPVLRADKEDGKWYPRSYQVFGPKLIATRLPFKDEALESRCLTAEMLPLTREDIPRVLPHNFDKEVADLRSKLLTFRLGNLMRLKGKTFGNELLEPGLQPRLQEILIPLRVMLNGDGSMVEALAGFVHRLQETLFSRRRESDAGRVLAAIIVLYQENQELSSKNIAEKANELDEEASSLNSEKVGWLTRRLGLNKEKGGSSRRRVVRWDQERIESLVKQYGLKLEVPLSPQKPSEPFGPFETASEQAKGSEEPSMEEPKPFGSGEEKPFASESQESGGFNQQGEPFGKPFEREPVPEAKGSKGLKGFPSDMGIGIPSALGMSREEAVSVWTEAGKPIIHLGPGENCFDLEKLLSHRDINERHLAVIRDWLGERKDKHEDKTNPL
jgi:hypothetical protein